MSSADSHFLLAPQICDFCLALGSKDNMTALVVKFPAQKIGEGGGVLARREHRKETEKDDSDDSEAETPE